MERPGGTDADARAGARRVALGVGSVIVTLTLLATILPYLLGGPRPAAPRPNPTVGAGPAESFPAEVFPEPVTLDLPGVPEGCPAPQTDPWQFVTVEWMPLLVADGRTYVGREGHAGLTPGAEVTRVACDIVEISGGGQAIVPEPWPDGSSTALLEGTPVHEVAGAPRECYLMAEQGLPWLFRAVDETGGTPSACVGVPEP